MAENPTAPFARLKARIDACEQRTRQRRRSELRTRRADLLRELAAIDTELQEDEGVPA